MNEKQKYRELCKTKKKVSLFLDPIWLDAIAPNNWDVVLAEKGNEILGAMPFFHKKKVGFKIITMPPLTPYLGPVLFYPDGQKPATRLSFEKEILGLLIDQLPDTDKFIQYFFPEVTNGLPFQWKGFEQNVRYTYIIKDTSNIEVCNNGLQGNIRRAIKKANTNFEVAEIEDPLQLHQLKQADYADKKLELNYNENYFIALCSGLTTNNKGCLIGAKDTNGNLIAAILFGWDNNSMYYVSGAINPKHRNSGALSLLLWEGIEMASEMNLAFNFEGSMIESIERYFRSFGAEQVPYFEFRKIDSKLLKLL